MTKRQIAALALGALVIAAPALARPIERWATPENERKSDAGEALYRCGTDDRGPKVDLEKQIDRMIQEGRIQAGGQIPVYFHVIYNGSEGNVSDADLDAQILVMNRNYAGKDYNGNTVSGAANTGYTFVKVGTSRTNSRQWFKMTPGTRAEQQAKAALAVSPGNTLNIYTCKPGQNLLGWSVFPWDAAAGTSQDGVVIHYGSLPNGYLSPYNLGGSATHEVGHYLGLYHTFQGGCDTGSCSTTGDMVCDTPAEGSATSGCPSGKDTCPATGVDPIHNYMDYSTDICYTNFTAGQDTRMNAAVNTYRSWIGNVRVANADVTDDAADRWMVGLPDAGERKSDGGDLVYRCGTDERGPKVQIDKAQIDAMMAAGRFQAGGQIPVYFHVITAGSSGDVPESQLDAQITVMNRNYSGKDYNGNTVSGAANTGYSFFKAGSDRTNNRKWWRMTPGSGAETQAKNALAINPAGALNIYLCSPGQNLLGWSVFPWDAKAGTNQDGVVIHYASLPGGTLSPYNLGGTATHEVGHYLGLYHTFQGGCDTGSCSTTGDLICDTPAQASATSGCPSGKDTCPATGLDPIHNYMDYSTDICYTNFTAGQDTRMNAAVNQYRSWVGSVRVANGATTSQNARGEDLVAFHAVPNPFNPRTKIEFGLRAGTQVSLRVFDIQGRLVATLVNRELPAGNHSVDFDGARLASGVYMMVLKVKGEAEVVKRISLLK